MHTFWLVVKPSFIAYTDPRDNQLRGLMMFDLDFLIRKRNDQRRPHLTISNMSRSLSIRVKSAAKTRHLYDEISLAASQCEFTSAHRFESFAPIRSNSKVKWIVDGASYFKAVAEFIEMAQRQIFITDWFLSPELHLKRPHLDNRYRLDKLLKSKAEAGIEVYILLYKEVQSVLGINSAYSKRKLSEIHPNIRVLRYPDHIIRNSTLLWANHEKSVVIDQTYALLGGIDLCYGRWDDCAHRLSDLGVHSEVNECKHINSIKVSKSQQQVKQNSFLNDCFQSTDSYLKQSCPDYSVGQCDYMSIDLVRRSSSVQLRDPIISKTLAYNYSHPAVNGPTPVLQCCLSLESGLDLNKCSKHIHIVEMCLNSLPQWSNPMYHSIHRRLKERMLQIPRLLKNHCIEEQSSDVVDLVENVRKTLSSHNCRLWIGKDYSNVVVKDFCDVNHPFKELIDRTQQPRLPWHDVGMLIIGAVANDVSRHFIQRWNYTKLMKQKQCKKYPFILPENPLEKYNSAGMFNCDAQVLRSVGSWSSGQHRTERSIHNAYIKAISESKYYIYIENQFFISRTGSNSIVRNKIVDTIFQRIRKAILENTTYFVYIVMPLMPAFEGAYGSPAGVANETITHWNYRTISHGSESLIARLCALGCDPYKFISFCALRNWGNIKGQLVTEMVYVHSKMMIVDDRLVIIGSANINDRSLTGNRDSEIAVCIEDQEFVLAKLNGKTNDVGKFASSLRIRIMREHLGDLSDPPRYTYDAASTDFFQNVWQHTAAKNTMIYTKVFNCSPLDAATRFEDLRRLKSKRNLAQTNISLALDFLKQLNGYLVLVPLKFLQNENLLPSIWSKEALVPSYFWT
ncbi:hypothetical protein GJ496_007968 [Pomphorhynchus laevis]|nr:hypothetical protein GJ496_007968 [Pomphorhynchus laevis]